MYEQNRKDNNRNHCRDIYDSSNLCIRYSVVWNSDGFFGQPESDDGGALQFSNTGATGCSNR